MATSHSSSKPKPAKIQDLRQALVDLAGDWQLGLHSNLARLPFEQPKFDAAFEKSRTDLENILGSDTPLFATSVYAHASTFVRRSNKGGFVKGRLLFLPVADTAHTLGKLIENANLREALARTMVEAGLFDQRDTCVILPGYITEQDLVKLGPGTVRTCLNGLLDYSEDPTDAEASYVALAGLFTPHKTDTPRRLQDAIVDADTLVHRCLIILTVQYRDDLDAFSDTPFHGSDDENDQRQHLWGKILDATFPDLQHWDPVDLPEATTAIIAMKLALSVERDRQRLGLAPTEIPSECRVTPHTAGIFITPYFKKIRGSTLYAAKTTAFAYPPVMMQTLRSFNAEKEVGPDDPLPR